MIIQLYFKGNYELKGVWIVIQKCAIMLKIPKWVQIKRGLNKRKCM